MDTQIIMRQLVETVIFSLVGLGRLRGVLSSSWFAYLPHLDPQGDRAGAEHCAGVIIGAAIIGIAIIISSAMHG